MTGARRWAKQEKNCLLMGAGAFGIDWLRNQTEAPYGEDGSKHRSLGAVRSQACRMSLGGLTRGSYSLCDLVEKTGYTKSQFQRACYALSQKWKRSGARGHYLITEDQLDDMLEWLKHDYWCKSKHLYKCAWCAGANKPHYCAGLCLACYRLYVTLCGSLGLPVGLEEQRILIGQLQRDSSTGEEQIRMLRKLSWKIANKVVLEIKQLEVLQMCNAGVK